MARANIEMHIDATRLRWDMIRVELELLWLGIVLRRERNP